MSCLGIAIPIIAYLLWPTEILKENNAGKNWTAALFLFFIACLSFNDIKSLNDILHRKIQCLTIGTLLGSVAISLLKSSIDNFFYFALLGYAAGTVLGIIINPHFFRSKQQI